MLDDTVVREKSHPVNLRVLVIGCDPTFLANVSEFLHLLNHQVWVYTNPFIAFSALRIRRNFYDLIITDLYLPDMDGFEVQKRVREEFKLPLIIVSADDREHVILKALKLGAAHYIVKPVCLDDVKNLWKFVVDAIRSPREISFVEEIENAGEQSSEGISDEDTYCDHVKKNSKRRRSTKESNTPKKAKLIWTQELRARFLGSVHFIGLERAVPKTILEVMNVEGLTRENVASHLQKYRQFLRKVAAKISVSKSDIVTKSQMSRSTFAQSRTSIFQQPPISGQNLFIDSSLGGPLFHANDHEASNTSMFPLGNTSPLYQPNFLSNFQMPQPAFIGYPRSFQPANPSSVNNGSGFQAANVQSNWSSTSGLQTQTSPLINDLYGNYNNYDISAGFQYNNNFDKGSWNGTMGFLNDSSSLISNNYCGSPPKTGAASLGLAGIKSNPNPNLMVENHGWASSTRALDDNVFGLVLNNIDQNVLDQDMINASPTGNLMFSNKKISGVEDASSVGYDGFTTVEAAACSSNVVDLSPRQNQIGEYFDELDDILFNDTSLKPNNQEGGKEVVNSYETSAYLVQENASVLEEPLGQACIDTYQFFFMHKMIYGRLAS
ncbi:two-component response regulator ARR10-like [Argentina anserina]|uniref:two-component response regulator ARR10-like n=1 Tax=Argentina anserina TaxID=57926 RepID=UPI0021767CB2|nr:two-component response regulator ARR10-like [Potentilla anserina]